MWLCLRQKKVSNAPSAYDNYIGKMYFLSNTGRPNLNFDMRHAHILFNCGSSTSLSFGQRFLSGNFCLEGLTSPEIFGFMHRSIPAAPSPPSHPQALPFFLGWPLSGDLPNAPRWGQRKRANVPPLGSSLINTAAVFIHCTIVVNSATFSRFFISVGLLLRLIIG